MDVTTMASLATNASIATTQGQIGIKVLGMAMEGEAAAAGTLVAELANMPSPSDMPSPGAGEIGGLLNLKA